MYKPLKQLFVTSALSLMTLACSHSDKPKSADVNAKVPLLNSERIAAKFGNYGVDLIEQTPAYRLSYLYSKNSDGETQTQTIAWVQFAQMKHPALLKTHRRIVSGASIGASLKTAGFTIRKEHLHTGTLASCERIGSLLTVLNSGANEPLAVHSYRLHAGLGGREYLYAQITEIHRPEYLTPALLKAIYGRFNNEMALNSALAGLADTKTHRGLLACA